MGNESSSSGGGNNNNDNNSGGRCYVTNQGDICTNHEVMVATNAVNSQRDTSHPGNQYSAMLSEAVNDIRYDCSADNIKGTTSCKR